MNLLTGIAKTILAVAQTIGNLVAPQSKFTQGLNTVVNTVSNVVKTLSDSGTSSGGGASGSWTEDEQNSPQPTSSSSGVNTQGPSPKPVDPLAEKKRELERAADRARDILGDPKAMFDLANAGHLASYAIENEADRRATLLALYPSTQMRVTQLGSLIGLNVATDEPSAYLTSLTGLFQQQQLASNQARLNLQTQQMLSQFDERLKQATNQYFAVPTPYMWEALQENPQQFGIFDESDSQNMLHPMAASLVIRERLIKSAADDGIHLSPAGQLLPIDHLASQIYMGYKDLDAEKYPYPHQPSMGIWDGEILDGEGWSGSNPEERLAWAKRRDELGKLWYSWTRQPLSDGQVMDYLHLEDTPASRLIDGAPSIREALHNLIDSYPTEAGLTYDPAWDTASYEDLVSIWRSQLYYIQGQRESWNSDNYGYQTQRWQLDAYAQSLVDDRTYWKLEGLDRTDLADFTLIETVTSIFFEPADWAITGIAAFSAAAEGRTDDAVGMMAMAMLPFIPGRLYKSTYAHSMLDYQSGQVAEYVRGGYSQTVAENMVAGRSLAPALPPDPNRTTRYIVNPELVRTGRGSAEYQTSLTIEEQVGKFFAEQGHDVIQIVPLSKNATGAAGQAYNIQDNFLRTSTDYGLVPPDRPNPRTGSPDFVFIDGKTSQGRAVDVYTTESSNIGTIYSEIKDKANKQGPTVIVVFTAGQDTAALIKSINDTLSRKGKVISTLDEVIYMEATQIGNSGKYTFTELSRETFR